MEVRALRQAGFAVSSNVVDTEREYLAALSADLDVIVCDNSLPRFNALKAADALRERGLDIPIIVVSGTIGEEAAVELLRRGVVDYLLKDRLARLGAAVERALDERRVRQEKLRAERDLRDAYDTTIEGWSRALDLRDRETEGHSKRVAELTVRMARRMGLPEADLVHVRRGALLHDIGKMGIPDSILLKPGPLNLEEWVEMRKHPAYAYQLLAPIAYLRAALDIPYCHHERWDGTGYPRGLAGTQIPLVARIFALADTWDALRSNRPYRPEFRKEQAIAYIREQTGRHFDPGLVDVFLDLVTDEQESADG